MLPRGGGILPLILNETKYIVEKGVVLENNKRCRNKKDRSKERKNSFFTESMNFSQDFKTYLNY